MTSRPRREDAEDRGTGAPARSGRPGPPGAGADLPTSTERPPARTGLYRDAERCDDNACCRNDEVAWGDRRLTGERRAGSRR